MFQIYSSCVIVRHWRRWEQKLLYPRSRWRHFHTKNITYPPRRFRWSLAAVYCLENSTSTHWKLKTVGKNASENSETWTTYISEHRAAVRSIPSPYRVYLINYLPYNTALCKLLRDTSKIFLNTVSHFVGEKNLGDQQPIRLTRVIETVVSAAAILGSHALDLTWALIRLVDSPCLVSATSKGEEQRSPLIAYANGSHSMLHRHPQVFFYFWFFIVTWRCHNWYCL